MSNVSSAKKIGRPRIDAVPVNVRLPPDLLVDLDAWISEQPEPKPSRPEAMRLLVADALVGLGMRPQR